MEEIWKDIVGYEGLYQVSNFGRVKSMNYRNTGKEGLLTIRKLEEKYMYVSLTSGKEKNCRVNRLVAMAFIPIPEHLKDIPIEKLQVGHLKKLPDGTEDKTANEVWNLAWMSPQENCNYGIRNTRISQTNKGRFTNRKDLSKPVLQIDRNTNEIIAEFKSTMDVKRQLGIDSGNISRCCLGKKKTSGGYKWQYK